MKMVRDLQLEKGYRCKAAHVLLPIQLNNPDDDADAEVTWGEITFRSTPSASLGLIMDCIQRIRNE